MKKKLRWRYYCDFCKKVSGSMVVMGKHERGCTNNPDRECGFCRIMERKSAPLAELRAILVATRVRSNGLSREMNEEVFDYAPAIAVLRKATDDCPACIFAAFLQSPEVDVGPDGFDVRKEIDLFWAMINSERAHMREMQSEWAAMGR